MNNYEKEAIGDIIIIKGLNFLNHTTGKQEPDHAWKGGRPCVIIYNDDDYDYFLPMTSVNRTNQEQYFKINNDMILFQENFKYKYNKKNRVKKEIKGSINLEFIYKLPISGHDKIGKITFDTYKQVIENVKNLHQAKYINSILKSAIAIRR